MKKLSSLLFMVLIVCAVSAQGFTVVINGTPFPGAVDGQPDAALLEAEALAQIPGLNLEVEGTQVKLAGKDFPSAYKQGRVMVEAQALTQATGGIYEVTDAGRLVKLTFRSANPAAQNEPAQANVPSYPITYSGAPPGDAHRQAFEKSISKLVHGIATSDRAMVQSAISSTCDIHAPPGDPTFVGMNNKPAQIGKILEVLGGQSPTKIRARYLPDHDSFSGIIKYRKKEIQFLGACSGKSFSIGEFGLGPLTQL